jgi:hypothetical protein
VNRRPTGLAAHAGFYLPALPIRTDEDVPATAVLAATVPPVTFNPHCLTLQQCFGLAVTRC